MIERNKNIRKVAKKHLYLKIKIIFPKMQKYFSEEARLSCSRRKRISTVKKDIGLKIFARTVFKTT